MDVAYGNGASFETIVENMLMLGIRIYIDVS